MALLVVVLLFVWLRYLGTTNPWKLTHWLFSYELGFVKRGLAGTLLQALLPGGMVTSEAVVVVALVAAAAFLLGLGLLALPPLTLGLRHRAGFVALAALLAPGVGYLLSDLGRFDVLNLALCVATILGARRVGRFPAPLFVGVSCVALLVHEAALLLVLPTLTIAFLDTNGRLDALGDPRRWPRLALVLAPALLLFVALVAFGRVQLTLAELLARLAAHADFRPTPRSAFVLLRPLDSNVAQVLGWSRAHPGVGTPNDLPLGGVDLGPFVAILALAMLQQLFAHLAFGTLEPSRRRSVRLALHIGFASPLPLFLVGVDWARWAALASAQSAVLMLLFARELSAGPEAALSRRFVAGALVFCLAAAGARYEMDGARRGRVGAPWESAASFAHDLRASRAWYEAFLRPRPEPRSPQAQASGGGRYWRKAEVS